MGRAPTLAEQAAVRELAALVDGPRKLRWFWRDERSVSRRRRILIRFATV